MDITELSIHLLILFFPGIICFYIVESLTVHRDRLAYQVFLLSYVYGALSYATYGILATASNALFFSSYRPETNELHVPLKNTLSFARALHDPKITPDYREIAYVTIVSILLALLISYLVRRKLLHNFAKTFKISTKFGELDVWQYAMESENTDWVTVRDLARNLMFCGYKVAYSDAEPHAELLLTHVRIYNESTGALLYEADRMYLSRPKNDLTIEFPVT